MSDFESSGRGPSTLDVKLKRGAKLGRRSFIGGILGVAAPSISFGLRHVDRMGAIAQTADNTAVSAATPDIAATPVSTGATPVPQATPGAFFGQLEVIEDQRPLYRNLPVQGGDLHLMLPNGSNKNFSPAAFQQDFQIMSSYLDPLIWIDEVTMDPLPWLAESWEWSRGSKRLTIKLRQGVLWHNGTELTAEDVVFSFYAYRDDYDSAVRNLFSSFDTVKASDDYTVVVSLPAPDGNFIRNACSQFIMQSKQYRKHWNGQAAGERTLSDFNWSKSTPIGTGPWKFAKREENEVSFSRNDSYWAGPPNAETLTLTVEKDRAARLAAWNAGEIDLLWPVAASELPSISLAPGKLYVADTASVMFAAFNFNNPNRADPLLFNDINLRRALSLAIDRDRYTRDVFGGFAYPYAAGTIAQPWANDTDAKSPTRDLATARKLLAANGYADTNGDGVLESPAGETLSLRLIVRNNVRPELTAVLKSIVPDLAEVGVELDLRELSSSRFESEWVDTHNFDLIAYAYNLYPAFTDFDLYGSAWDIRSNIQGWNPGGYSNRTVDQAIRAALIETNSDDQAAELKKLQQAANDDLFALWFGFPRDLVLVRPDVEGFQPNKQWQTWGTAKLWKHPT